MEPEPSWQGVLGDRNAGIAQQPLADGDGRLQELAHHIAPVLPDSRRAKHRQRRRIERTDAGARIEQYHASWQGIKQRRQALGERLLLLVLPAQLAVGNRQFLGQRRDPRLQGLIGLRQLCRNLIEQRKCMLQFGRLGGGIGADNRDFGIGHQKEG